MSIIVKDKQILNSNPIAYHGRSLQQVYYRQTIKYTNTDPSARQFYINTDSKYGTDFVTTTVIESASYSGGGVTVTATLEPQASSTTVGSEQTWSNANIYLNYSNDAPVPTYYGTVTGTASNSLLTSVVGKFHYNIRNDVNNVNPTYHSVSWKDPNGSQSLGEYHTTYGWQLNGSNKEDLFLSLSTSSVGIRASIAAGNKPGYGAIGAGITALNGQFVGEVKYKKFSNQNSPNRIKVTLSGSAVGEITINCLRRVWASGGAPIAPTISGSAYNSGSYTYVNLKITNGNYKNATFNGTAYVYAPYYSAPLGSYAINKSISSYATATIPQFSIYIPTTSYGTPNKVTVSGTLSYTDQHGAVLTSSTTSYTITIGNSGGDPCLKKDTYITMADGSRKFVQDLRIGDKILGYDFENNTTTPAIVMAADKTKSHQVGTYVVFSDGTTNCITRGHNLYSVEYGRYLPIEGFEEGYHVLNEKGEEVELMAIHWDVELQTYNDFYHIVSSNNTYFAEGIMHAGAPIDKYRYLHDLCHNPIAPVIKEIIFDEGKDAGCFNFTVTDPNFIKLGTPYQYQIKKSSNQINKLEKAIKETEGIASKIAAGLGLNTAVLKERANYYDEIDKLKQKMSNWESEYNNLLVKYSNLGEDILLPDKDRREKYFKRACKIANEKFDIYKYYYTPIYYNEETGAIELPCSDDPTWRE